MYKRISEETPLKQKGDSINKMKRFFDIPKDRLTLAIDVNEIGMKYTVEHIEKVLKISGLREIDIKEYNKLSKEYTK